MLVRASGTEPLIRVMVEAPDQAECDDVTARAGGRGRGRTGRLRGRIRGRAGLPLGGRCATRSDTTDRSSRRIAGRRHGVVDPRELLGGGRERTARSTHRLRSGILLRSTAASTASATRAPSTDATYLAAVLACGPGRSLGGRAAAHLYGSDQGEPPRPRCTPDEAAPAGRAGHAPASAPARTRRSGRGIPTDDRAAHAGRPGGRAWKSTTWLAPATRPACVPAPRRARSRRCSAAGPTPRRRQRCGRVMRGDTHVTLSTLEARFLALLRAARPAHCPMTNRPAGGRRSTAAGPTQRLTVELDGYRFHNSRHTWERDHRREREAYARGDEFRRYTSGMCARTPAPDDGRAPRPALACSALPCAASSDTPDRAPARRS